MGEWINAAERRPEERGRYLVCLHREAPENLGGCSERIVILRWDEKGWLYPTHFPAWINEEIKETVTHWMNLPDFPMQ